MSKERYIREHDYIIDNNKRNTNESLIVYDEEWNTLDDLCDLLNQQDTQIADLEAKLAEKDEEIKTLNKYLSDKADEIEKIACDYKRQLSASNILTQAMKIREHNQDKISFAVEQLEKVKETLIQNADEIGEEYKEDYFMISLGNVKNIIDNQIEKLKKEKK